MRVGQRPFSYLLNLTGDWTDAEGKHLVYRIRLNRAGDATNYYLPSSAGHNRYIYVTEKRLEEFTISGVGRLPAGQYTAQLEVMINSSTTQPYVWDAGSGPITFQVW